MKHLTIGWKVSTLNFNLASLRYRALIPILALEKKNIKSKIFKSTRNVCLSKLDALVIVKSFTMDDYGLALEAVELGIPVVFDLCDNIFIEDYIYKNELSPSDIFLMITRVTTAITVTTEPLAAIVKAHIGDSVPVYIVPDGVENRKILRASKRKLLLPLVNELYVRMVIENPILRKISTVLNSGKPLSLVKIVTIAAIHPILKFAYRKYDGLRSRMTGKASMLTNGRQQKAPELSLTKKEVNKLDGQLKTILWFGNHGAPHAQFGISDLVLIQEALEKVAAELPVELVVVSNNFEKYRKYVYPMSIVTRYIAWDKNIIEQQIKNANVVVIPNSLDDFSICKSANRTVLAISQGTPVVATNTPALEDLGSCVIFNDFEAGIKRYLTDTEFAKSQVLKGKQLIKQLYGEDKIAELWMRVVNDVVNINKTVINGKEYKPDLIIGLNLIQDIPLAFPLIAEAKSQGVKCSIWTSVLVVKRYPQILSELQASDVDWRILTDDLSEIKSVGFPKSVSAVFSVTESNLSPHRFTHELTNIANASGVFTATMQHGYENIGLSYSDDLHDIKRIKFASSKIFTWGVPDNLHPDISSETRQKCIPVGCPKPIINDSAAIHLPIDNFAPPFVGIFENLHWHRYSEKYRSFFLEAVERIANLYPNVKFLIKPHNAGMWLTSRHKGDKPEVGNIIIADPAATEWKGIAAPQLLNILDAVITTPSTVALDAARVFLPTAVVRYDLELDNYQPLSLLNTVDDWSNFLEQALDCRKNKMLQEKSKQFVDRVIMPSEKSAWRIINEIKAHQITVN